MAGIAWVNGKLLPPEEAAISPLDSGFLYGEGLFETMRAYSGRAFRLPQHLDRLFAGAAELDFTPPGRASIAKAIADALVASELPDASVRLTLTPGIAGASSPTLVVLVRPLALPPPERYEQGCTAISVPAAQVGATLLRRVKSLNYLDKLLAQRAAAKQGAHEAILVDPDGCIVEGAMRNIFAVIRGELVTPPPPAASSRASPAPPSSRSQRRRASPTPSATSPSPTSTPPTKPSSHPPSPKSSPSPPWTGMHYTPPAPSPAASQPPTALSPAMNSASPTPRTASHRTPSPWPPPHLQSAAPAA